MVSAAGPVGWNGSDTYKDPYLMRAPPTGKAPFVHVCGW